MKPKVAVLSGFGINCESETIAVFEMAGATVEKLHINKLVNGSANLENYHIMAIPGGFSFGDHLGSGRLMGNRLRFGIREQVREFVKSGKLVIGICNGFQVLVKMGLLPGDDEVSLNQSASLTIND
jgi:phosphoribosylformylglycinamidine (FGAM) synthase-like amidotransferase family enzyme